MSNGDDVRHLYKSTWLSDRVDVDGGHAGWRGVEKQLAVGPADAASLGAGIGPLEPNVGGMIALPNLPRVDSRRQIAVARFEVRVQKFAGDISTAEIGNVKSVDRRIAILHQISDQRRDHIRRAPSATAQRSRHLE